MILAIILLIVLVITNWLFYFKGQHDGYDSGKKFGDMIGYRRGVDDTEKSLLKEYQERARLAYQARKDSSFAGKAFSEHMKELNPGVPVKINPTKSQLPPLPPGAKGFVIEKDHPWGDEQRRAAEGKSGENKDD